MVAFAILVLVIGYVVACGLGWPQHGTELVVEGAHHDDQHPEDEAVADDAADPVTAASATTPGYMWVGPFALLLLCIAVLPLLARTEHWWESNLHRFYVAAGLGLVTLAYYLLLHDAPVEAHWPTHDVVDPRDGTTWQWRLAWTVFANAILHEYIPFIVLLFSLYAISGGIRIEGNLAAHPMVNTTFIAVGGLLASFIGTTGAAMLLIRPLLETNRERKYKVHTVVFFIFVVCNCGGCLLPIGDPPLFLGYLRGVEFLWTMNLWPAWLFVNAVLLTIFWVWDHFVCYPHEAKRDIVKDEGSTKRLQISGWQINVPLLIGVVLCVALLDPSKTFPGTKWHAPLYLREILQMSLVGISLWLGDMNVRQKNQFTYHAIIEVAVLFIGIFVCMQPALQILNVKGATMGVDTPMEFFWMTGGLSSMLDNAPTYVVFFETAKTLTPAGATFPETVIAPDLLIGISLGAVFMGAMTYIGNGPNFMVKAIAETSGIKMPSFFGYLSYSCLILLPVFGLATYLFL
jgi:Na+/H+ antiporter NhaD/arsenite permease-like protein